MSKPSALSAREVVEAWSAAPVPFTTETVTGPGVICDPAGRALNTL